MFSAELWFNKGSNFLPRLRGECVAGVLGGGFWKKCVTACVEYYQGARSLETAYSTFLLLNLSGVCVYVCVCFHMGIYLSQQVNFPSSECQWPLNNRPMDRGCSLLLSIKRYSFSPKAPH